ncbi:MAG TPA: hypothetical protein VF484_07620 [Candidatus Limnocylindrales bacterium]
MATPDLPTFFAVAAMPAFLAYGSRLQLEILVPPGTRLRLISKLMAYRFDFLVLDGKWAGQTVAVRSTQLPASLQRAADAA